MLHAFSPNPAGYVEPWGAGTGYVEPTEEPKAAAGTGYVEVKVPASSKTCAHPSSLCKQFDNIPLRAMAMTQWHRWYLQASGLTGFVRGSSRGPALEEPSSCDAEEALGRGGWA